MGHPVFPCLIIVSVCMVSNKLRFGFARMYKLRNRWMK